jgi:hypothetical protein
MRKLTPAELVKIAIWINVRLERVLEQHPAGVAAVPHVAGAAEEDDHTDAH